MTKCIWCPASDLVTPPQRSTKLSTAGNRELVCFLRGTQATKNIQVDAGDGAYGGAGQCSGGSCHIMCQALQQKT